MMIKEEYFADYLPQVIEDYKGNPFIEALPPIMPSAEAAVGALSVKPVYNETEREQELYYRLHSTMRLNRYFQPLYVHLDIEQRVSRCIRQGYVSRNPITPQYVQRFRQIEQCFEPADYRSVRSTAIGFTMIGISGIGKTTAIERVMALYPQCIIHTRYAEKPFYVNQVVWMKLECPYDGSIKGLCLAFFSELDRILQTGYSKSFSATRNTVYTMMDKMSILAHTHGLGLLIVDEVQNLSQAKSGGSGKMLNFFVTLVNTIGVPVILIGTPKALPTLQSEFRQARRGSGQGDLIWDHMKNDDSWEIILRSMWKYQWTRYRSPFTEEMKDAIYEETQGIIDIAVKIYGISQIKAIYGGIEHLTVELIRESAAESMKLVKPMLDALRSGDLKKIMQYEDIRPISIDEYLSLTAYANQNLPTEDMIQSVSLEEQAVSKLIEMDIPAKTARSCVKSVLTNQKAGQPLGIVIRKAFMLTLNLDSQDQQDNSLIEATPDKKDLRSASVAESYTRLKEMGALSDDKDEW
ncbi:MAG: ATP-binding protein [Oscillospiraceae bacterium]|nr:ATP-binding protein [Oscillospiraceae bacterium]